MTLNKCTQRKVQIIVKGQTYQVIMAAFPLDHASRPQETIVVSDFRLNIAVRGANAQANVLLTSSDLTHVKVKRANPETGKTEEMIFDLEKDVNPATDLWLRDGDIIEIPDKP